MGKPAAIAPPTIRPIPAATAPRIERYTAEGPAQDDRSAAARRSTDSARHAVQEGSFTSPAEVEEVLQRLGIQSWSARAQCVFFLDTLDARQTTSASPTTPQNRWGLAAYTLNALSVDEMVEVLAGRPVAVLDHLLAAAQRFTGVGPQAQCVAVLQTLIAHEQGQLQPTELGNQPRDWLLVRWNRAKFWADRRIILSEAAQQTLFFGDRPAYGGRPDLDPTPAVPPTCPPELAELIWHELRNEGSCASVNVWDNALFSWGRGFAGYRGGLMPLLVALYREPAFRMLFAAVGLRLSDTQLHILVGEGQVLSGGMLDEAPWRHLQTSRALQLFFIALGEMQHMPLRTSGLSPQEHRQKNADLQFAEAVKNNGLLQVPPAQYAVWKAQLAPDLDAYRRFMQFLVHLFHWLPAFGKEVSGQRYAASLCILKEADGQYIRADIRTLLLKFAEKASGDPWGGTFTEIDMLPPEQQRFVAVHSLLRTRPIQFATLLLDTGHLLSFGGSWDPAQRRNAGGPADRFFAAADKSGVQGVTLFKDIRLFDPKQPMRGYEIIDMADRPIRLNTLEFNGAALYFKFKTTKAKGKGPVFPDLPPLEQGYLIRKLP